MTKLLFIGSFPVQSQGGTSTASLSLKKALVDLGIEVFGIDSTIRDVSKNGFFSRLIRGQKRASEIKSLLKRHRPSHALIFCGHGLSFIEKSWWMVRLKRKGLTTMLAPRSGLILKSVEHRWFERILKRAIQSADYVLCQGKYWRTYYSLFAPNQANKFIDFPNWVDPVKLNIEKKVEGEKFKIAIAGWLNEDKGILDVIPIATLLKGRFGNFVEINFYGKGPLKNGLLQEIATQELNDIIKVHDWKKQIELWKEFKESSLLLFLSRFEGMPNNVMEALIQGLPVVSTNISTIPELIEEGKNGFICNPGDIEAFVHHISKLIEDEELLFELRKNAYYKSKSFASPLSAANKLVHLMNGRKLRFN